MRVSLCHLKIAVSHQPLDGVQIHATDCQPTREGVSKIMKSKIVDFSFFQNGIERFVYVVITLSGYW